MLVMTKTYVPNGTLFVPNETVYPNISLHNPFAHSFYVSFVVCLLGIGKV
jgi:hypothetical protein